MDSIVVEVTRLLGLFIDLGVSIQRHVIVFSDNKLDIQLAANPTFHRITKHREIDCYFIRHKIKSSLVHTVHVPTQQQTTDLLIKGLAMLNTYT